MDNIEGILKKLVSLRSYIPYENEPYSYLTSFLLARGFNVKKQKVSANRYNLLAERGVKGDAILFYMHIDTVSPPESYSNSPLILSSNNDKYFGLGCFDMKGGIAALLSILDSTESKSNKIKLAFCVDEEVLSEGAYKLVRSSFLKDISIAFCPEACIVPENWNLPVMFVIGGRGRCVMEVTVPGHTVHGAEDVGGVNAIDQAAILIRHLNSLQLKRSAGMGKSSFFVRSIYGSNQDLSIPDRVTLEIDYQLVIGETPESVIIRLDKFIKCLYKKTILSKNLEKKYVLQLKPRQTPYIAPYSISRNNKFVKLIESTSQSLFGSTAFNYTKSVADQNILANADIPIITIGPIGGNPHQSGEWVSAQSLQILANLYKEIFQRLSNGGKAIEVVG